MIIKKIKLENIRSYERFEMEFPGGSVLLSGDIGSGKTTILLAIEFALFGLQPGQKGSSILRSGKDYGSVELEIEVEGVPVKIERGLAKKAKSITQEETAITISGEREVISTSELKNKVLKILNYPMEFAKKTNLLYKFTVYTPQEEMKQIILEDAQTRLNAIRHVFGINKYKIIRENIAILTAYLREDIRTKEGIIRDLEEKKQTLDERKQMLVVLNKNMAEAEHEFNRLKEERKSVEEEINKIKTQIDEKKKLEQEIEKTKIAISGKGELILAIEREIKKLSLDIAEIKRLKPSADEIKKLEFEKQEIVRKEDVEKAAYLEILAKMRGLQAKNLEKNSLKQKIQQLQLCPTCLQSVDNEYKSKLMSGMDNEILKNHEEIKKLQMQEIESKKKISEIAERKEKLNSEISEMNMVKMKIESMKDKETKLIEDEKRKETINKDIQMLSGQIERLKAASFELNKFSNLFIKAEEDFKNALKIEREADLRKESIRKEIEMTKDLIEEMKREIEKKEGVKEKLIRAIEIHDWVSKQFLDLVAFTERNVLLKLREEFSKIFNEWFNILVPDVFSVSLDEDFTPVIFQQDFELDYDFLSGGERTAIALAYRLALNKTINSVFSQIKTKNLVILDEPTDGFSEQQLDKMRDVLEQLDAEQLIIVSHEQKIESFVESVIRLKKEHGLSGTS